MLRCIIIGVILFPFTFIFAVTTRAQNGEKCDLRKCVEYALQNNISIKQADLQIEFAMLDLQQSRLSQYPSANFSGNIGYSSGRNQDPTSFGLITTGYLSSGYSLQS